MVWMIIVLLPKGNGEYRGIGLLEPFWKVTEIMINKRFRVIELHDCLHSSIPNCGTGMAILESKLIQPLALIE